MGKIKIQHFGAIQEGYTADNGWLDIKKVTVFIGNQGSGKSTVAKLISSLIWIEKALVRGDYNKKWFERKNKFQNQCLSFHRLENYFKTTGQEKTIIDYEGEAFRLTYQNNVFTVAEIANNNYPLPQIMYVPAERNFISYVKTAKELKLSSPSLKEFLIEFENAKNDMKAAELLPINNASLEYDRLNDTLNIRDNGHKIKLTEASSGFQSLVPMFLVSKHLANSVKKQSEAHQKGMTSEEVQRFKKIVEDILQNNDLTDEQKRLALSVLSSKFNKTAFINIVEEPEQNLFPASQWEMLKSLLKFNAMGKNNKLIITTHSPYIINYLSIAIQAQYLDGKIKAAHNKPSLLEDLYKLIPQEALVAAEDVAIYQLNEKNGSISKLDDIAGIPSDKNYLNQTLIESNSLFDELLEIEENI